MQIESILWGGRDSVHPPCNFAILQLCFWLESEAALSRLGILIVGKASVQLLSIVQHPD